MGDSTGVAVALIGNPNTGKSSLFSALAGVRQRIGNYPGVTVEKKLADFQEQGQRFTLIDLPGTYSLAPQSPDEMVAVDVLLGRQEEVPQPAVVVCIVDASNLSRNLFLVSQVLEIGLPTVVALNMVDVADSKGHSIDVAKLQERLGTPVVTTQANRGLGVDRLKMELIGAANQTPRPHHPLPDVLLGEASQLQALLQQLSGATVPQYLAVRLILDDSRYVMEGFPPELRPRIKGEVEAIHQRLEQAGSGVPGLEAQSRYAWIDQVLTGVMTRPKSPPVTWSDRLDRFLTNKLWGTLTFLLLMILIFQAVFRWAGPLMDGLDGSVGFLAEAINQSLPEGALRSLLVDGVVAGVGGVLVFLPQIFILFFFIAVLEDCGYMARAAYLMDRLMSAIGLSGKSFIPLLSSFACAIPGIMAARVIENRRDRLVTILVAPLMSCSARLPVYLLMIAAFVPAKRYVGGWITLPGLVMFAMYMVGIVTAILVAWVLKKSILQGETPPFVMELPTYKVPALRVVLTRMLERGWSFIRRAGTLILAVTVVVWALGYFPRDPQLAARIEASYAERLAEVESSALAEQLITSRDNEIVGALRRQSYLGRMGRAIEPVVRPLGWDWRIGCAVIASFPAREVVIGTMGVIYNLGDETDEQSVSLRDKLRSATWDDDPSRPVFNLPVALSIMVFFALCAQCGATLVVIRRETNSWFWPVFTFVYMTGLAYVGALATYQIGMLAS